MNFRDKLTRQIFPVTKVISRRKPMPQNDSSVIRIRILERPMRWYKNLSYHWQAFINTVILSAILIWVPYGFVYYISYGYSKAEIMAKQDPGFTSDEMKVKIREFKKRKQDGQIESMKPEDFNK
eukprot:403335302